MILIVIGAVFLSFIVWSLLRFKRSMSGFVSWILGAITGTRTENQQSESVEHSSDIKETSKKECSKTKGTKVRQRQKKSNDPTFSTDLLVPIENIIEETITEETKISGLQNFPKKKEKSKGQLHKQKSEDLNKGGTNQKKDENIDNIGYSFLKPKLPETVEKEGTSKARAKRNIDESPNADQNDDVGFSFFPAREKGRKNKNKVAPEKKDTPIVDSSSKKSKDISKSSIIDHYIKRNPQQTTTLSVTQQIKSKKSESKKSKVVSSSLSYASVLTQNVDEGSSESSVELNSPNECDNNGDLIDALKEDTAISTESDIISNSETPRTAVEKTFEDKSESISLKTIVDDNIYIDDNLININDIITQTEENNSKILEENSRISKSNSSSIEVISENQEDNFEESYQHINKSELAEIEGEPTPFDNIEGNLNQLIDLDSTSDQLDATSEEQSYSRSSSISVVDGQSELEHTALVQQHDSFVKDNSSQNTLDESKSDTLVTSEDNLKEKELNEVTQLNDQNSDSHTSLISVDNNSDPVESQEVNVPGRIEPVLPSQESHELVCKKEPEEKSVSFETTGKTDYSPADENCVSERPKEDCVVISKDRRLHSGVIEESTYTSEVIVQEPFINTCLVNTASDLVTLTDQDISQSLVTNTLHKKSLQLIKDEKCDRGFCSVTENLPQNSIPVEELSEGVQIKNLNMTSTQQVRVLTLNNQEHQECTLYRLEKNWIIQFRLGPSLFGRKVYLYCNYPIESAGKLSEFNRNCYQLLNWALDEGCHNADDTAAYTQIHVKLAGSFHYYFTYENGEAAERQGSGFFLVDPILKYGNNEDLFLDCIQCQTVLAKNLGSFSSWEGKLQVAKESGYNMIHFTPIQELGASNSCYSLSEQLKLNPIFKKENGQLPTFEEMEQFMMKIRREWKVTSVCDIVLNHTANESVWIKDHPEVTYNCSNCPYMRPAYLLDAAFHQFSMDVKRGFYEDKGIPPEVNTEEHLNAIRYHFRASVLEPLKIQDLYICNVNKLVVEFLSEARTTTPVTPDIRKKMPELVLIPDPQYKRLGGTVDMKLAQKIYNLYWPNTFDEESRLKRCAEEFKSKLDSINNTITEKINDHLTVAVENVIAGIRYFRVQADGPKFQDITIKHPLVYRYFTEYGMPKTLKEHEEIMYSGNGRFLMAHNGWVMNYDPLKNFAAPDSNIYIRRELIAWGDSVKLRYGDNPEDCPFLWEHMRKYVEETARIFDGVRLDNCHSTPIPVAEYLLDCARKVKPDLYVVAELFTNSDMTDNIFVNRLGITSLVREAMSAWDSHEEGRLVYRYGGYPVGSFYQPSIRPLVPSIAHALFLDLTHDNPSPVEKRSVFDLLPSTALVNMACCASGSNRGYDELVPHHIHVVDETREYTEWTNDKNLATENLRYVTERSGIISAKKALNDLHFILGKEGFNQVYVDQMDSDIVAVTRHCPETHQSYILVAFTAFQHPSGDAENHQRGIKPLRVEGVLEEIVLEATLSHNNKNGGGKFTKSQNFVKDSKWINGLSEYQVSLKQHINITESDVFEKVYSGTPNVIQLNFKNFKPGSIAVIRVELPEAMKSSVNTARTLIGSLSKNKELVSIVNKLTLADLNRLLYRCDQEERDEGFGFDTYSIPNFSSTVYAGLQGFISLLANIRPSNDLGHPMCANLRDGNWMIEYIWKRLLLDEGTKDLGKWLEENSNCFNDMPRYLVPCYFDAVVTGMYILLIEQSYKLMSLFVNHGSTFVRGLSLGSVQFAAYIKSSDLPVLSPNLVPPKPPTKKNDKGELVQACVTLSAGLPHFSVGYMRNWGRDTFIALRGLFILTGRFQEARQHILGYGACLRHGLIPNLLDGGRNPRFNCRDAIWWWLFCIKEYAEEAPNGLDILSDVVSRIFPTDDAAAQPPGSVDQPLHEVIQEALTVHFQGLAFRERNAGRQIDEHMTDRGFNNHIGIHPETGFVFGGNEWNCGTWMDKMGSSDKIGNRGKPATPRDGSAVELIGLSKAVITWLAKLSEEEKYPYSGVQRTHKNGSVTKWSFKEWSEKIQANFERCFWVNTVALPNETKPNLINKRGIYKDCYGATQEWTDYQLRCNFPITMVVAPELFTPQQAWIALKQAEKYLLGPLGMKTLDPEDWAYRGDYDNSNDSNDASVAHGFNYHQGPEWVWPVGYFLRAKLHFASANGALKDTVASTKVILAKHFAELQTSPWRGLPELTNSNGSYCKDSAKTQAWSMACVLEVLSDLQKIESSYQNILN
ncbi:hypothetical protein NQ318_001591 [Aromia moschata]|uniref:Glycogen debranching enzyme n=1 Tax=Aromia moschata TaxID=1265417 RepID=A0AAV8Y2M6_9CUCU|nr:hypothetical protein NQ318_001591 [Aromia moschata]